MAVWRNVGKDQALATEVRDMVGTNDSNNDQSTSNVAANRDGSVVERLEHLLDVLADDEATNFIGVDDADNAVATTNVVANRDGSLLERSEFTFDSFLALPRCVEKTDGACLGTGGSADPIFTITGGPVRCRIFGIVTTQIGAGTTNAKFTITTTTPSATVDMSAAAVDIDADAAGTSYRSINTTAIFTPVTAGFVMMGNAFATQDTEFFCPIGTINFDTSAARAGVVAFYCEYTPLSPSSRVTAAA